MKDVALPPLLIKTDADGFTVVAIQKRSVPLFHARLSLPAGTAFDPGVGAASKGNKAGLAQFTADLLRRGTTSRDAHGVDALIEGMGAQLSVEVSLDESALGLTVPAELAAAALDALLEVALRPSFPEAEVTQARRRALAALQSDLDEPGVVAGRAAVRIGYGETHPYGHAAAGTRACVETFTRADAAAFHAARFQRRGALLAVAGPGTPEELLNFARERLAACASDWAAGAVQADAVPAPAVQHAKTRALVVHKPDSTQAQVRIVSAGLGRRSGRYHEVAVANTALGGGFTSVLVDAIRVDRGLSYSVSSRLSMGRHTGLSLFSSFTKNETLRELIDVAFDKMRGYAAEGPSAEALAKTQTYLAGLFPFGLESHEALAENISDCVLDGTGLDHLAKYRSRTAAVTREGVLAAARDLSPGREGAQIIVVGDGDVAARALSGLCPVEVTQLE